MKMHQPKLQHRIVLGALLTGLLAVGGFANAQSVGVGVGARADVAAPKTNGPAGANAAVRTEAAADTKAGAGAGTTTAPTNAAGNAVGGVGNTVGGAVGGATGAVGGATNAAGGVSNTVGGTLGGVTGAAGSTGTGMKPPGTGGARIEGQGQGSGALGIKK